MAGFREPALELAAARDAAILADLSHNALYGVTGDDAGAFLHGQLTNDVQALGEGAAQWNGWCSPKGRLLASFLLLRAPSRYLLLLPAEIAAATMKRLAMFVLRSKVKIADASEELVRFGVGGKAAPVLIARHWEHVPGPMQSVGRDGAACIALGPERFVILAPPESAPGLWRSLSEGAVEAGADSWEWLGVRAGVPTIVDATREAFVPQMANFELVGGVSFHKGCYPGQEIVARTQYRGILKRRMALAHVDGASRPAPGDSVYSRAFGDQSAGTIANAAPSPDGGFDVLVVAQLESLDNDDLRWPSPDGAPLIVIERPYASIAQTVA